MQLNIGGIDRSLRLIAGIAIIAWGVVMENYLGAIGLVPLLTGLMKWCPLYQIFGIKSCSANSGQ